MTWYDACTRSDVIDGQVLSLTVAETPLILLSSQGKVSAYFDRCSHQDVPLSAFASVEGGELTCLAHGARFSISSGKPLCFPAQKALQSYKTRIIDGMIQVAL